MKRMMNESKRALLVVAMSLGVTCFGGCVGDVGGGVQIEPEVSIKVDELDDEDVATLGDAEAGSVPVAVRAPSGQVIAPPEQRIDE